MRPDAEADRLRRVYAAYDADPDVQRRRDPRNRANLLIDRERVTAFDRLLDSRAGGRLGRLDVLDVGCGDGDELLRLQARGVRPERCHGIDLLPDRVKRARERLPDTDVRLGDARQLPFPDACFDLIILKVILSSVLDDEVAVRIAREVDRVLRPGGAVLWYDDRYTNPFNANVRALSRRTLRALFPGYRMHLTPTTVLPLAVRPLGVATAPVYRILSYVRLLSVRYAGLLEKPSPAAAGDLAQFGS
jgi:ubiquinone/menaquinone biosynthesis C-methylase UbiE